MFMPPTPASRNFRPTDGMPSYRSTLNPAWLSTSAAIRPAGPPPMMATCGGRAGEDWVMECAVVWLDKPRILPAPITVGASLLAKAVCHSALMFNVMASSRAGSLPHGFCGVHIEVVKKQPVLCRLCAAWAAGAFAQVIHRQFHRHCG